MGDGGGEVVMWGEVVVVMMVVVVETVVLAVGRSTVTSGVCVGVQVICGGGGGVGGSGEGGGIDGGGGVGSGGGMGLMVIVVAVVASAVSEVVVGLIQGLGRPWERAQWESRETSPTSKGLKRRGQTTIQANNQGCASQWSRAEQRGWVW